MDKGTVAARKAWLKFSLVAVSIIIFITLAILPIYWAALGRSSGNIHNLSGYVVVSTLDLAIHTYSLSSLLQDFDGGQIGQAVTQAFSMLHGQEQLSWLVKDPSEFPNGPWDVQLALLNHRCWAAVTSVYSHTMNIGVVSCNILS